MNTISYNELYSNCATPCIQCAKTEKGYNCIEPETQTADAELKTAEAHIATYSDQMETLYYMIDNIVHDIWQSCGCSCEVKAIYRAVGQAIDMLIDYERYIKDVE